MYYIYIYIKSAQRVALQRMPIGGFESRVSLALESRNGRTDYGDGKPYSGAALRGQLGIPIGDGKIQLWKLPVTNGLKQQSTKRSGQHWSPLM